jgi:short-subunit dehydrogenase
MQKKIVIVGATSGMGEMVAKMFIEKGYKVGVSARREEKLMELKNIDKDNVEYEVIDVMDDKSSESLLRLINKLGGMDEFFLASGVGYENEDLDLEKEIHTMQVNALGFVKMVDTAFNYFKQNGGGHISCITSIAGTKGLGAAPSYSSTKRFQNFYLTSLEQLSHINNYKIRFTDIRPGFVDTALLDSKRHYPLLMKKEKVAKSIVKAIINKKRIKIIDWRYRLIVCFWKAIPNCLWVKMKIKTKKK